MECFAWTSGKIAIEMELQDRKFSPTVPYPITPPWLFPPLIVDLHFQEEIKRHKGKGNWAEIVDDRLRSVYKSFLAVFTDGSKDPKSGLTGFAFTIPELKISIKERTSDHLTVFTVELLAILTALQWIEQNKIGKVVICSDSLSSLMSLQSLSSNNRLDIVYEMYEIMFRLQHIKTEIIIMWIPAHRGIEGNEAADALAKQALNHDRIMEVAFSKAESKAKIRNNIMKEWQKQWDEGKKGRHLYNIKQVVGRMKSIGRHTREHIIISRLRLGHTGLNKTMHLLKKHPSGMCECGMEEETAEHVISQCVKYENQRIKLRDELKKYGVNTLNLKNLFKVGDQIYKALCIYLKETGLIKRI